MTNPLASFAAVTLPSVGGSSVGTVGISLSRAIVDGIALSGMSSPLANFAAVTLPSVGGSSVGISESLAIVLGMSASVSDGFVGHGDVVSGAPTTSV